MTAMMMMAIGCMVAGCSSLGPTESQSKAALDAYKLFAQQSRSVNVIDVTGSDATPATVTLTGTHVVVATPVPPLSALGNDDTRSRAFEQLGSVGRMALGVIGAIAGFNVIGDIARSSTGNGINLWGDSAIGGWPLGGAPATP